MKIYSEIALKDFAFWAGAIDTVKYLSISQLEAIENILEDIYSNGVSNIEINDLFWFEADLLAEWLGYADFDELRNDSVPWN